MKRYFLTAFAIAIGGLTMGTTSAFAQDTGALPEVTVDDGGEVSVPFATVAAGIPPSCLAVPTPGVIVQDGTLLTSAGGTAGNIVLTCTVGTNLSAGTPVAAEILAGVAGTTEFSSTASLSESTFGAGINTVQVNMEATTDDDVIKAGAYAFTVPVTVTYQ